MSCEPDGSAWPAFSAAYSSRTRAAGSRAGSPSPHSRAATLRVLVPMPQRSMKRQVGSSATTTIEPGGVGLCCETNGWSIHPPANAMR